MSIRPAEETIQVILDKSSKVGNCLIWSGRVNHKDYGQLRYKGRKDTTHRAMYDYVHGGIPAGMHVLHRCDTPRCVHPKHLFVGTNDDNVKDKILKGRMASKLKAQDVLEIRKLLSQGMLQKEVAKLYGVNSSNISRISNGKRWGRMAGGY